MKKIIICVFFLLISMVTFAVSANASSYTSTLSLGQGKYVIGSDRNYTAGDNSISIKISSFTKVDNLTYTKLYYYLEETLSNSCLEIGSDTKNIYAKTTYSTNWGYLNQGTRHYYFSTKVDGYSYGGVKSKKVVMSSGNTL